ncbi:MAG: head-tail adaptor protein [Parcubacteria group bacterium]|jgi:SPP1 family predicted phage head-tail adaptor|nr:head-tail adaptor protein [Parcubacteria group bacterium]|tara:strand:+ start:2622 stop:2945 length:324 start_codon:yes stop_codon:yes gene_type:complete
MRARKLRHRVTIQSNTESRDATRGAITNTYATLKTVWANVGTLSTKEYFSESQRNNEVTSKIRIRYLSTVTTAMRVVHGSDTYEITGIINPDGKNCYLDLMCKITDD